MDKNDVKALKQGSKIVGRNIFLASLLGLALNLQLKKIPNINFLNWNFLLRYFLRVPVFVAPQLLFYSSHVKNTGQMTDIHIKYGTRWVFVSLRANFLFEK